MRFLHWDSSFTDRFIPGMYAIKVNEEASDEVQEICRSQNRRILGKLSMEENA